jgi:pentatricopeptide repeat protein
MRTYSTLINAISKSGNVNASKQATDLLKKMINLFINGDLDEAPNAITYSSVMDAYAVDGDIDGAMNILNMMKDDYNSGNKTAKPNLRTYNILINAISKSDTDDAPQQAEILLTTMIYLYSKRELLEGPNSFTYSSVMYAYAVQGDIDGANDVHEMMKNEFKSGNKKCRPNVMTYSILIKAWAKSGKDNTPEEVEKILQEMKDLHKSGDLVEGPNHITYTSMIDSLQKFDGTEDRVKELISLQKK